MTSSKEVPFPSSEYIPECHDRYTDIAAYDVPKYLDGLAKKYNMHFKLISATEHAMFNDKCCIIIGIDRRDGVILNMTFLENGRRTEYIMNGYLINKFDDPDRYSLFHDCVPTDENIRNQLTMVSRGLDSKWSDLLNGDMNWFEDFKKTSFYYELKVGLEYRNKILEEIIAWQQAQK